MGKTCSVAGVEWVCVWADDIGGDYNWIWEPFDNDENGEYPKWEIKLKRNAIEKETTPVTQLGYPILIRKVVGDGVYGEWDDFMIQSEDINTLRLMVKEAEFLIEWCNGFSDTLTNTVY